eukprot:6897823-Heterocapsa_arctica.AAC.1
MAWRIVRRIACRRAGVPWDAYVDVDPMEPRAPAFPGPAAVAPPPPPHLRKLKTSLLIDQGDDSELGPATAAD